MARILGGLSSLAESAFKLEESARNVALLNFCPFTMYWPFHTDTCCGHIQERIISDTSMMQHGRHSRPHTVYKERSDGCHLHGDHINILFRNITPYPPEIVENSPRRCLRSNFCLFVSGLRLPRVFGLYSFGNHHFLLFLSLFQPTSQQS